MNNRFSRIVCGFLSVVMCIFSTVNVANIKAEDETPITEVYGALQIPSANPATTKPTVITLNGQPITPDTVVSNNDKLSVSFSWSLPDTYDIENNVFVYDLGINENVKVDYDATIEDAKYEIIDSKLYLTLLSGESGREGGCTFEGTVSIDDTALIDGGTVEITVLGETFYLKAPSLTPSLWVEKSAAASFEYENGEFYRSYTITVHNDSDYDVSGAKFTDIYEYGDDKLFADGTLYDLKINGDSASGSANSAITIPGTIAAGESVEVTYRVKISKEAALNNYISASNKAQVDYNNGVEDKTTYSSDVWVSSTAPRISKSGEVSTDSSGNTNIDWTVTVYPGMLENLADFIVIDTPDGSYISVDDIASAINDTYGSGSAEITNNSVNVKGSIFNDNGDGSYTLTYTTKTSAIEEILFDTTIKNDVTAEFELDGEEYSYSTSGSATVEGTVGDLMKKENVTYDKGNGKFDWKITIDVPNDPSISEFIIDDSCNEWDKKDQIIDYSTFKYTVDGEEKSFGIDQWTNADESFKMTFTPNGSPNNLSEILGKKLVITYSSIADPKDQTSNIVYMNQSTITVKSSIPNATNITETDKVVVGPKFTAEKAAHSTYGDRNNIVWRIYVNKIDTYQFSAGQTITVVDELPDGYILDEGYTPTTWWTNVHPGYSIDPDSGDVTFTVKLDAETAALINSGNPLNILFGIKMTDEAYAKFITDNSAGDVETIENNATVKIGENTDEEMTVTGKQNITVSHSGILDKQITSQSKDEANGMFSATYKINVNKDGLDLIQNGNEYTLTDTLGTWLELNSADISVEPDAPVIYNEGSRSFSVTLQDETPYVITYSVTGDLIPAQDSSDSNSLTDDQLRQMFSNTVTLHGVGNDDASDGEMLSDGTYSSKQWYIHNITISGKKLWEDDGYSSIRPKSIAMRIKQIKRATDDTITETYLDKTVEVTADGTGKWTYKISDLIRMDAQCNRYEYIVEEITVDGYTVSYNSQFENGTSTICDITNTFTADDIEKGKIVVDKVWVDNNNANRPAVKFVLKNTTTNKTWEKTLGNDTSVTFEDLPLYAYSRDAQDKLVRTPYEYTISELTVAGEAVQDYTVAYEESIIIIASANDIPTNENEQPVKTVTVTNTYEAPLPQQKFGAIKVTKEWYDNDDAEKLRPEEITFVLMADGSEYATQTVKGTTATFENLPVYKVVDGAVTDEEVVYTVEELEVAGYTTTYTDNTNIKLENGVTDNVTVTNTFNYKIEKGSVTVSKVWQNENGNPVDTIDDSVTVTLYADGNIAGTKTLTRTSTASFDDLPVYKYTRDNDGKIVKTVIQYTLSETPIDGYITSYTIDASELNGGFDLTTNNDRSITVTNRKESADQKHGSVKVTKTWDDGNSSLRPETITVVLNSDDNAGERTMLVTPDAQGKWEAIFTGLPVFKTDVNGNVTGEKVTYTLTETSVDGYDVSYTGNADIELTENSEAQVSVENKLTHTPEKGSITVNKEWQDENGGTLPENEKVDISVTLSDTVNGNSDLFRTITTAESSVTFNDLPVYESYERNANGIIEGVNPITYYVTETTVNGFETTYSVSPSSGLSLVNSSESEVTITNKKKAEALGSIKVTKNWDDKANTENIARPAITVILKADNIEIATKTISSTESTATFENLPVYKSGGITKIQYSVVEQRAFGYDTVAYSPDGSFVISENDVTDVTITNTFDYELKKGNISVTKKWVDSDGSGLAINDTITVVIKANGEEVVSDRITGSGTKTFSDLPMYTYTRNNDGSITASEIIYTVSETSAVSGYNVSYTLDGSALKGGFALVANDTREVVIENKKIAVATPDISESQSTTPSGGSGGGDETDDNNDGKETTPTQSGTDTTPTQGGTDTTPTQSGTDTTPTQSSTDTTPTQSSSGTRPSYTTPSYVQITTTVKNTTTTTAADTIKGDGTTTPDEEPEETTVVDEDTDTTKPADPDDYEEDDGEEPDYSDDYEEDDSDEVDESEDEEDEMQDEDGDVDDYIGEDTDFETDIEENPHTSITINFGYVLSFAFGAYAFFPRKKKKN